MRVCIISIVCMLLLYTNLLYTQSWPKYYGQQNRPEYSKALIESYDNGFLICGDYFSNDYTKRWAWIIKTDINGNIIWNKMLENSLEYVYPSSIAQTHDGGFVLCGTVTLIENVIYPLVAKFNACGEKEWCKVFTGSQTPLPSPRDIKVTESGEIVVLVNQFGSYPVETLHLFKLSADGEVLWQQAFATTYNYPNSHMKIGQSLMITSNDKYLISGRGYWRNPWSPQGPFIMRSFFVMSDNDGNEEWVLPFGLNDTIFSRASSVIEINTNRYLAVAYNLSSVEISSLLIFFDSTGTVLNHLTIDNNLINPDFSEGLPVKIYLHDSVYLIGGFYGNTSIRYVTEFVLDTNLTQGINVLNHIHHLNTSSDYGLIYTADNKLISQSTFSHSSSNTDIFLAKLNLNLEYDTAYTGNYTYDSLCISGPPQSGFIYLNDCDIVLGTEMPTAAEYRTRISAIPITIYPNPAKDHITFALENTEHHRNIELRCFNLLGMQQHQTKILRSQQQTSANISAWPPGMYVVVVYSDGRPVGRGKFVVQK